MVIYAKRNALGCLSWAATIFALLLLLSELNCSVKQRTVVAGSAEGKPRYIPYIIYSNITNSFPSAEPPPTEAENKIATGNPRQVKRTFRAGLFPFEAKGFIPYIYHLPLQVRRIAFVRRKFLRFVNIY